MAALGARANQSPTRGAELRTRLFALTSKYSAHFLAELVEFPAHLRRQGQ
jgi:hypothetical protein